MTEPKSTTLQSLITKLALLAGVVIAAFGLVATPLGSPIGARPGSDIGRGIADLRRCVSEAQ